MVLFSLFKDTVIWNLGSDSILASPMELSLLSLLIASDPLLISSLTNISLSEYNHFLIIGIMFSV